MLSQPDRRENSKIVSTCGNGILLSLLKYRGKVTEIK